MLALELPHSVFLIPALVLLVLGIALLTIAKFWPSDGPLAFFSRPVVTSVWPVHSASLEAPGRDIDHAALEQAHRTISWPALVDAETGALDTGERRFVIDGLAIAGDAWCATVLAKAFDEEDDDLRVAAVEALGRCEGDVVAPTLERAYASHVIAERYAAVDGASRRADVALLERALRDTDGTVALAAAYGLHRATRDDLIETGLAGRTDARADEIRRVLPILA